MEAVLIYEDVMLRLGLDCPDVDTKRALLGEISAVQTVMRRAGIAEPADEDLDRYIECVVLGVNDLKNMSASGGGFSDGFIFMVNQIRMGGA